MNDLKAKSLPEILAEYPKAKAVLADFNLLSYAETKTASLESLEASAIVNQVDLVALLAALETAVQN